MSMEVVFILYIFQGKTGLFPVNYVTVLVPLP